MCMHIYRLQVCVALYACVCDVSLCVYDVCVCLHLCVLHECMRIYTFVHACAYKYQYK